MPFIKIYDEEHKETELKKEIDFFKNGKIEDNYIRQIISKQKGQLDVKSRYFKKEFIAEANWSILDNDEDIKSFDTEEIGEELIATCIEHGKSIRKKDAEYTYIFIPSYYAVKKLILYYLRNSIQAKRIYGLRNAVVRRDDKKKDKFYGGLPFILKYMRFIYTKKTSKDDSIKYDFAEVLQELLDRKIGLEMNNSKDDFINDIIDCINNSVYTSYIRDKRIKDFTDDREKYYCIDFNEKIKNKEEINFSIVGDYKILMHRDVEKDWAHIQKYIEKANEIIANTPRFPNNIPPKNDPLDADIKGWFSQRVSHKDRVVYKKDSSEKTVYIATVCDHYKNAARRTKSRAAYK